MELTVLMCRYFKESCCVNKISCALYTFNRLVQKNVQLGTFIFTKVEDLRDLFLSGLIFQSICGLSGVTLISVTMHGN